jgi:hypothetical protein
MAGVLDHHLQCQAVQVARQRPRLLQDLLIASKHPRNSLCLVVDARRSFESMYSDTLLSASVSVKPLNQH